MLNVFWGKMLYLFRNCFPEFILHCKLMKTMAIMVYKIISPDGSTSTLLYLFHNRDEITDCKSAENL